MSDYEPPLWALALAAVAMLALSAYRFGIEVTAVTFGIAFAAVLVGGLIARWWADTRGREVETDG